MATGNRQQAGGITNNPPVETGATKRAPIKTPGVRKNSRAIQAIVLGFFTIIILLAIIIAWTKYKDGNKNSKAIDKNSDKQATGNNKVSSNWTLYKTIEVDYSGEYDEKIFTESGMGLSFSGATEPYEVKNSEGQTANGDKGEDASTQLPGSHANMELRFKSKNGNSGHIKVLVWQPN